MRLGVVDATNLADELGAALRKIGREYALESLESLEEIRSFDFIFVDSLLAARRALSETVLATGTLVVVGPLSSELAFALGRAGIRGYLPSLSDVVELSRILEGEHSASGTRSRCSAVNQTCETHLDETANSVVGGVGLIDAQRRLRFAMAKYALHLTFGNRHAASRLLRVDRRYILKLIEEDPSIDPRFSHPYENGAIRST